MKKILFSANRLIFGGLEKGPEHDNAGSTDRMDMSMDPENAEEKSEQVRAQQENLLEKEIVDLFDEGEIDSYLDDYDAYKGEGIMPLDEIKYQKLAALKHRFNQGDEMERGFIVNLMYEKLGGDKATIIADEILEIPYGEPTEEEKEASEWRQRMIDEEVQKGYARMPKFEGDDE
jgi:hypothetical protein